MISVVNTPECQECRSTDLEWYSGDNYLCSECGQLTGLDEEE